jgi:hypothetical protein
MAHNFISTFNPVMGDFLFIHCTLCSAREGSDRATAPCERAVQEVYSIFRDSRLKCFDRDNSTNVYSDTSWKNSVKNMYNNTCLLCGQQQGPNVQVTVAHIVANNTGLADIYKKFGPPQYVDTFNPESVRNRIALCGSKTAKGT